MMGLKKGVPTQIKNDIDGRALCTHCYCHALNIACSDSIEGFKLIRDALDTSFEITKSVKYSPKRESALKAIQGNVSCAEDEDEGYRKNIRMFCQTRWTVRAASLNSIFQNYTQLEELWDWCLTEYQDTEAKARAGGVKVQMKSFDFFFGIRLGYLLLSRSDNLSASLQSPDLSAADGQAISRRTVSVLETLRDEDRYIMFWERCLKEAPRSSVNDPKLPRTKKAPKKIEECIGGRSAPEYHNDEVSYYRQIYFDALDYIINSIKDRFEQPEYQIYVNLENLLLKAAYEEDFEHEFIQVVTFYKGDFNTNRLRLHLQIIGNECRKLDSKNLSSITVMLRSIPGASQSVIEEVYVLVNLILVMPATNSSSERSFSMLKLIKTYLRSTMGQTRLNHLMILSIYKDKLDELNLTIPAKLFIDKNESRRSIFGDM